MTPRKCAPYVPGGKSKNGNGRQAKAIASHATANPAQRLAAIHPLGSILLSDGASGGPNPQSQNVLSSMRSPPCRKCRRLLTLAQTVDGRQNVPHVARRPNWRARWLTSIAKRYGAGEWIVDGFDRPKIKRIHVKERQV